MADEEQQLGCCHGLRVCLVHLIHAIDIFLGLLLVIYGIMIAVSLTGQPGLPIFFIVFGGLLLTSAIMAIVGIRKDTCKRAGLVVAMWMSPVIALIETILAFYILFGQEQWMSYIVENKSELYLSDAAVSGIDSTARYFGFVGFGLAFLELLRFFTLMKVRSDMRADDVRRSSRDSRGEPLLSDQV